jgi:hypothetical protein
MHMLGSEQPLQWSASGKDLTIKLPPTLPGNYAYVLEMDLGS